MYKYKYNYFSNRENKSIMLYSDKRPIQKWEYRKNGSFEMKRARSILNKNE